MNIESNCQWAQLLWQPWILYTKTYYIGSIFRIWVITVNYILLSLHFCLSSPPPHPSSSSPPHLPSSFSSPPPPSSIPLIHLPFSLPLIFFLHILQSPPSLFLPPLPFRSTPSPLFLLLFIILHLISPPLTPSPLLLLLFIILHLIPPPLTPSPLLLIHNINVQPVCCCLYNLPHMDGLLMLQPRTTPKLRMISSLSTQ